MQPFSLNVRLFPGALVRYPGRILEVHEEREAQAVCFGFNHR